MKSYITILTVCAFAFLGTSCARYGVDMADVYGIQENVSIPEGWGAVRGSYITRPIGLGEQAFILSIVAIDGKETTATDGSIWFNSVNKRNAVTWQPVSPGLHVFDIQFANSLEPAESNQLSIPLEVKPAERYTVALKELYSESHFLSWSGALFEVRVLNKAQQTVALEHAMLCRGAPADMWGCQNTLKRRPELKNAQ